MTARFLIADHDPLVREGCRRYLSARGFDVHVTGEGLQCLDLIRTWRPTILVLDRHLLWGDGDGVLECLCDEEPVTPLRVLLTDGLHDRRLPKVLQRRVTACLTRPHSLHELENFIDRLEDAAHEHCLLCPDYEPLAVERVFQ
jgi:DNA-binding response OmpR family regulator